MKPDWLMWFFIVVLFIAVMFATPAAWILSSKFDEWRARRAGQIAANTLPSSHTNFTKGHRIMEAILDKFRMLIWLVIGMALYVLSYHIGTEHPTWQTITYKLGHVTTLSWVGYWIGRMALGRVHYNTPGTEKLARAVIIAGVIIAGSLGL